jgi:pilus assembly protein CpaB
MKRRSFGMFIVALLLAGGATLLANRWLETNRLDPNRTADAATTPVVVAALQIPFAQKIEAAHIKTVAWPQENAPEGAFSDPAEVVGKVASQTIVPNEPVLRNRVVEYLGGSTLSAFIKPNMRAVSIRVNDVTGVGGFVLPGNQVDVIQTRKEGISHILLENIRVLAIDQEASPDKDKPAVVRAVTLELTPEQAEILVKATQEGVLHLALRNPLDDKIIDRPETPQVAAVQQPIVREPKRRRMFTIIRGDDEVKVYRIR